LGTKTPSTATLPLQRCRCLKRGGGDYGSYGKRCIKRSLHITQKMLIKSKNLCFRKTCRFFLLKNLRFFWKILQVKEAIEKPVPTLECLHRIYRYGAE
jgi:hypothetical protein